jgi:hypothetical protein
MDRRTSLGAAERRFFSTDEDAGVALADVGVLVAAFPRTGAGDRGCIGTSLDRLLDAVSRCRDVEDRGRRGGGGRLGAAKN